MNNEIFFWIVAFILVWEVVYILWMRYNKKYEDIDYLDKPMLAFEDDEWYYTKFISLFPTAIFFWIQFPIIRGGNYINLLWEFLIIVAIVMLFYANKLIAGLINGENGQSTTRRTRT